MEIRLDGKSAIVTGGSKALGLAIAQVRFCRLIFPQVKERRWAASSASSTSAPRR